MVVADSEVFFARYSELIALCKGGESGQAPVPRDALKDAPDARSFCLVCFMNLPAVKLAVNLLGLREWFLEAMPEPPVPMDSNKDGHLAERPLHREEAGAFRDAALDMLFSEMRQRIDSGAWDPEPVAYNAIADLGCHFTGKLVHSKAVGAYLFAPDADTRQPHVSSRTLRKAGIPIPIDYKSLDNGGVFQQVRRVIENDPVAMAVLPSSVREAMQAASERAFRLTADRRPDFVDPLLKQILLPNGDEETPYLAVSPLGAGGLCAIQHRAVAVVQGSPDTESSGDAPEEAEAVPEEKPQKKKKGRKAKSDGDSKETPSESETEKAPATYWFSFLDFPIGGGIPRNVSIFPVSVLQRPLFFDVPQRNLDTRKALAFLYRPLRIFLTRKDAEALQKPLHESLSDSDGLLATKVQSGGEFGRIVRRKHAEMVEYAAHLAESLVRVGEDEVPITEDVLRSTRKGSLTDLDRCVLLGDFGGRYREAFAEAFVDALIQEGRRSERAPLGSVEQSRIRKAVVRILETF